jgi:hypothetical protein
MQLQQKLGRQDKQWTATTVDEIRAYLGIRIFMSVLQLPAMEMYWSTDYMLGNLFGSLFILATKFLLKLHCI